MTTNSSIGVEEQLTLRIERELSYQMDEIIDKMQKMANKFVIDKADKKSPFKNVLSVATETSSSLEVIKSYIRYQVGRKESSPVWKISEEQELFATAVVEQINSLLKDAKHILQRVKEALPPDSSLHLYLEEAQKQERLQKELHLKLTQLYLGYLAREHTALVGEAKYRSEQSENQQNQIRRTR